MYLHIFAHSIDSINTGIDTLDSKIAHFFQPPSMALILHSEKFSHNLFHCACLAQGNRLCVQNLPKLKITNSIKF